MADRNALAGLLSGWDHKKAGTYERDDEALQNYRAMTSAATGPQSGWDRDILLPLATRVENGKEVLGGGILGSRWHLATPRIGVDMWNALKAVGNASLTAPYNPDHREEMIEGAGAWVGPQMAAGFVRNALKAPRGAELGSGGGRPAVQGGRTSGSRAGQEGVSVGLRPEVTNEFAALAAERSGGDPAATGIRAYHGSPHDFDKFSLDKIGTGEGAQAYGHGLYFAENEGVAKTYRDALAMKGDHGKLTLDPILIARRALHDKGDGAIEWLQGVEQFYRSSKPDAWFKSRGFSDFEAAALAAKEAAELVRRAEVKKPGHMYEVNIKASPEQFLDWDLPLSKQSEKVQTAIRGAASDAFSEKGILARQGRSLDEVMTDYVHQSLGAAPAGAKKLRDAGIAGIRYKDAGSRGTEGGTSNYVVFDDKLIEILRKYGLAGMMAGGAAATSSDAEARPK